MVRSFHGLMLLLVGLTFGVSAQAADGVGPFGLWLGRATASDVKVAVQARGAQATPAGVSPYTHGPILKAPGSAFGMEGLQAVTFVFDSNERLAATVLTLAKHRFDAVLDSLLSKYAVRERVIPFVGNRYVRLGAPGATVELTAPHLSFEMELAYQRDDFVAAYRRALEQERARKRQAERDAL